MESLFLIFLLFFAADLEIIAVLLAVLLMVVVLLIYVYRRWYIKKYLVVKGDPTVIACIYSYLLLPN